MVAGYPRHRTLGVIMAMLAERHSRKPQFAEPGTGGSRWVPSESGIWSAVRSGGTESDHQGSRGAAGHIEHELCWSSGIELAESCVEDPDRQCCRDQHPVWSTPQGVRALWLMPYIAGAAIAVAMTGS